LVTNAPSTINPRPSTSPRRFIPLRLDDATKCRMQPGLGGPLQPR
jgi:hypothetical protein